MVRLSTALLAATLVDAEAAGSLSKLHSKHRSHHRMNPARKVISLLEIMKKRVDAQGKKKEAAHEEFMCYCKTSTGSLGKSIGTAEAELPQLKSSLKGVEAEKKQVVEHLKSQKIGRTNAETAVGEALSLRAKEKQTFDQDSMDSQTNIKSIRAAVKALEKGSQPAFLQTSAASVLRSVITRSDRLSSADRDQLASFLSAGDRTAAPSEILGILKQMDDDMSKDLSEMSASEESAVAQTNSLVAAKEKEINTLTKAVEVETGRAGEKSVDIANFKNDVEDTEEQLVLDQEFLGELQASCTKKKHNWELYSKTMTEELLAITETIKLLNDDDALDLFHKTLASPDASSFLQVSSRTQRARRSQAGAALRQGKLGDHRFQLVLLALSGKTEGFEAVVTKISELKRLLATEQLDDDKKKQYCDSTFDKILDEKKSLEREIADVQKAKSDTEGCIEAAQAQIEDLKAGIKDLDQQVAKQTGVRKEENDEFQEIRSANNAAIGLIELAKNRLAKFYDPKLYKAPPKRELSEEDRITSNMGGTLAPTNAPDGIAGTSISASFLQLRAKAQATKSQVDLGYKKQREEKAGVIEMLHTMTLDLTKQNVQAEDEEAQSQSDYEAFMKEAAAKRAEDSKALADKEGVKAELEEARGRDKAEIKSQGDNLVETKQEIQNLHVECDFLLKEYDVRKEARASEMESLTKAVSVLRGAGDEGL